MVIEKPFGHDYKSADHLQSVVGDIYAKNKSIALIIISAKILLITSLPLGLAIFCWNHFGTGVQMKFRSLQLRLSVVRVGAQYYETAGAVKRYAAEPYASGSCIDCYGTTIKMMQRIRREKTKVLQRLQCHHLSFLVNMIPTVLKRVLILTVRFHLFCWHLYSSITGVGKEFLLTYMTGKKCLMVVWRLLSN